MKNTPALFIVSGDLESGKTRFCQRLAQAMRAHGWDVSGIVSPAVFQDDTKIGIDALDLRSGKRRRLAELIQAGSQLQGPATKRWQFSRETLAWCNSTLRSATPCDLLVIDELGPLEFERGAGIVSAIEAIEEGNYLAAVVVIRRILLAHARRRWPLLEAIDLTQADDDETLAAHWAEKLVPLKA
jgi:nucleoside-triphosphatase THEP1